MAILSTAMRFVLIFSMFGALAFISPLHTVVQAAGSTVVYNLYATDTFIRTADPGGAVIYNYGFVGGRDGEKNVQFQQSVGMYGDNFANTTLIDGFPAPTGGAITPAEEPLLGNAQFPAPLIYAKVGDVVEIRLKNLGVSNPGSPNDPHSIHLHGLDVNAANDGVPETSLGAIPANSDDPGAGNVVVYMFKPTIAGTYMYHCHQEADIHVNMGMYGALVIYNPGDVGATKGPTKGAGTQDGFQYDRDYVMLLSEIDVNGHADEQGVYDSEEPYNWSNYHPNYWFINGLSFPQTIHAGFPSPYTFNDWVAAHPGYDPLIQGSTSKPNAYWGTKGEKLLLRMINMGYEAQPMHMHGYHGKMLTTDARIISWANAPKTGISRPTPFGKGAEKNTLLIGSGETYDWLIDIGQQSMASTYPNGSGGLNGTFPAGTQSRTNGSGPVANTVTDAAVIAEEYVGGPAVPQIFPFHNHDDYKATNNGVYPGGMFTMIVVSQ